MESTTFRDPKVQQELAKFVFVKLFVDKPNPEGPANKKLRDEKFQSNDLPLYVLVDKNGQEVARLNYAEFDVPKFVAFLKKATAKSP